LAAGNAGKQRNERDSTEEGRRSKFQGNVKGNEKAKMKLMMKKENRKK
jgi:hypothetical protein